jgi:tetratricopeptide (TPR) repeat protein
MPSADHAQPAALQVSTSGDNSPAIMNPEGPVTVNYGMPPEIVEQLLASLQNSLQSKDQQIAQLQDDIAELITVFKRASQPTSAEAGSNESIQRSSQLVREGKFGEAGSLLEKALASQAKDTALLHYQRGEVAELELKPLTALENYEKAYETDPQNADYGFSYANMLLKQHDHGRAEPIFLKVLAAFRQLAAADPAKYRADLARTLNNLGALYSETGDLRKTKRFYEEALIIRRELAEKDPELYQPELVGSLINMGNIYSEVEKPEKAEAALQEALKIERSYMDAQLKEQNLPEHSVTGWRYVTILNNLGSIYDSTGRPSEAEDSYRQAVEQSRILVQISPAYRPTLAMALANLGTLYADTNRFNDAEAMIHEALEINRSLVEENPSAHLPALGASLSLAGLLYSDTDRFELAEKAFQEALSIRRELVQKNPSAYRHELARTLFQWANCCKRYGRTGEAEKAYLDALAEYRCLQQENPERFLPRLGSALTGLGELYRDTKQVAKAEETYNEALDVYRNLTSTTTQPATYEPYLAGVVTNLILVYLNSDRAKLAEDLLLETLDRRERLRQAYPDAPLSDIGQLWINLGTAYLSQKRYEDAEALYNLALQHYLKLSDRDPSVWQLIAACFKNLAAVCDATGRPDQARQFRSDVEEINKALSQS